MISKIVVQLFITAVPKQVINELEKYRRFSVENLHSPVDTGRKLDVHKTFRRRPGRLLNVLCMFNLRPVSTGS